MKKLTFLLILLSTVSVSVFSQGGGGVKNGQLAPNFSGKDQDGNTVSLDQYKGKKVVLYFYPKDDTPGCTAEACSLRDNYDSLTKAGYTIIGVSADDQKSHKDFKTKYNLPFTLIADTDKTIANQYGVWVEKERDGQKFMGMARTTFIIDEKGTVVAKIEKVDTKDHAKQVLGYNTMQ
ncbi:thioredoxin-dependent thiol peroxidase [Pollutibacter soli]|uniref:thioredoxin-dependent thiol peroxidase n=1 Tax=Pollutibacter soli TaxID=3034157 RepID=UPI003013BA3D